MLKYYQETCANTEVSVPVSEPAFRQALPCYIPLPANIRDKFNITTEKHLA